MKTQTPLIKCFNNVSLSDAAAPTNSWILRGDFVQPPGKRNTENTGTAMVSVCFCLFCIYSYFLVLSGGSMSSTETLAQSLAQQMLIKQQVDLLLKVIKLFQNYFI